VGIGLRPRAGARACEINVPLMEHLFRCALRARATLVCYAGVLNDCRYDTYRCLLGKAWAPGLLEPEALRSPGSFRRSLRLERFATQGYYLNSDTIRIGAFFNKNVGSCGAEIMLRRKRRRA